MNDTIRLSENSSDSSALPLNTRARIVCHVCNSQFSQYTCPRCNSRYCSLQCYKAHSIRCTESFMKENVLGELQQLKPNDETKQKMIEILKRFHAEEEEETDCMKEDGSTLSEEIIEKVLAGDEISFEDLSVEDRKRFQRAVVSGDLSKMIEPWDPWWLNLSAREISLSKEGMPLVQPISEHKPSSSNQSNQESNIAKGIPPGPESPMLPISKLSLAAPSPFLPFHLIDLIYSYCFTLRIYNGDCRSDPFGLAMTVLSVSSVLGQGGQPETAVEVLGYCLEQTCSPAYRHMGGRQLGLSLVDDVVCLLSFGSPALICMLCDLQRVTLAGEREINSEELRRSKRREIKSKLKSAERKVYFIMCWVHEQPPGAWSALADIVSAEKKSILESRGFVEDKVKGKGSVLIEEIE